MKHFFLSVLLLMPLFAGAVVNPVNVRKMDAEFKQTRISEMTAAEEVSSGNFRYNADAGVLIWTYSDGTDWKMSAEMMAILRRVLQGRYEKNNPDFVVREDGATLILTPKKKQLKARYKELQIRFNPFTGYLQEITFIEATGTEPTDPRGDTVIVEFRNVEAE